MKSDKSLVPVGKEQYGDKTWHHGAIQKCKKPTSAPPYKVSEAFCHAKRTKVKYLMNYVLEYGPVTGDELFDQYLKLVVSKVKINGFVLLILISVFVDVAQHSTMTLALI